MNNNERYLGLTHMLNLVHKLRAAPEQVARYNGNLNNAIVEYEDGKTRLVLVTPAFHQALQDEIQVTAEYRARFAFRNAARGEAGSSAPPELELYDAEGEPIGEPMPVHELPVALGEAIEKEVGVVLLGVKALEIAYR